jgi:ADP-ribose pyrophosphatase YjhB (NUDIX family)
VRAQVVLLREDRILLARHDCPTRHYWVLPGGAVEEGETPELAAVREVREETGLDVRVEKLLFVDGPRETSEIRITSPRYTYLGVIVGGELCCRQEADEGRGWRLSGCEWLPLDLPEYDAATRDTLNRVKTALASG